MPFSVVHDSDMCYDKQVPVKNRKDTSMMCQYGYNKPHINVKRCLNFSRKTSFKGCSATSIMSGFLGYTIANITFTL